MCLMVKVVGICRGQTQTNFGHLITNTGSLFLGFSSKSMSSASFPNYNLLLKILLFTQSSFCSNK